MPFSGPGPFLGAQADTAYQVSRSLRFRGGQYFNRTPASAGNRRTFTISYWTKRGALSSIQYLFSAGSGTTEATWFALYFDAADTLNSSTWTTVGGTTTAVYRDPSSWYHVVVAVDTTQAAAANRCKIYVNGVQQAAGTPTFSLNADLAWNNNVLHYIGARIDSGPRMYYGGYMAEVYNIDGQALTPSSFGFYDNNGIWQPKGYTGAYGTNGFYLPFTNTGNGQNILTYSQDFTNAIWLRTTGVTATGDTVAAPNGTTTADTITYAGGGTAGNYRIYYTSAGIAANGTVYTYSIWLRAASNVNLQLSGNFGSVANITVTSDWQRFSLTVTGNGSSTLQLLLYSPVGDNSAFTVYAWGAQLEIASTPGPYFPTTSAPQSQVNLLGADYSLGSSYGYNSWVPNNISVTAGVTYDSMIDSPTNYTDGGNGRGNYCVLNHLSKGAASTYANGNLQVVTGLATSPNFGTIQLPNSGKWYWEYVGTSNGNYCYCGISNQAATSGVAYYGLDGNKYINFTGSAYGATYTTNNLIGVAVDVDAGTITFYKDNVTQGSISYTIADNAMFPYIADASGSVSATIEVNFGQRPFAYTPPSGYLALNTQNLPTPTITNGAQYMAATTYEGNGTAGTSITNGGNNNAGTTFQPDFVWLKSRSTANSHTLADTVRGAGGSGYYTLATNLTNAENTSATNITAINPDGFTLGSNTGTNGSGATFVGWQWKAGGTPSTIAVNAYGSTPSIASSVSANTTAGFSVVGYTGTGANATVGHGLGVAPSMFIVKDRTGAVAGWNMYHTSLGSATSYLQLNTTAASATLATLWNSTAPTSTVFSIGTAAGINTNGSDYVAYCFAPISGYSAFGSYTGNGSTNGPFIYTGFRPRWVLYKITNGTGSWTILDTSRTDYNVVTDRLFPDLSNAEDTTASVIDILSNGFKMRSSTVGNTSAGIYIYAAFAENPFKYARAR